MRKANIPYADDRTNMLNGEQYWFYDHSTALTRCPMLYKQIIERASHSISIWDPYFNVSQEDDDTRIFAHQSQALKWRFLMNKAKCGDFMKRAAIWETHINHQVPNTHKSGTSIEFRNFYDSEVWSFHDRFLIVDADTNECQVYLVGSSVSYHLRSQNATGICRLDDEDDKKLVKDMFELYWKNAKKYGDLYNVNLS